MQIFIIPTDFWQLQLFEKRRKNNYKLLGNFKDWFNILIQEESVSLTILLKRE